MPVLSRGRQGVFLTVNQSVEVFAIEEESATDLDPRQLALPLEVADAPGRDAEVGGGFSQREQAALSAGGRRPSLAQTSATPGTAVPLRWRSGECDGWCHAGRSVARRRA